MRDRRVRRFVVFRKHVKENDKQHLRHPENDGELEGDIDIVIVFFSRANREMNELISMSSANFLGSESSTTLHGTGES